MSELRDRVVALLRWEGPAPAPPVDVLATRATAGYVERLIEYPNAEQEPVRAFVLVPDGSGPWPGIVVHHQHNGERHLGKSEVAGHAGDPLQAFGPAPARRGFVVLAPDTICFEDRRRGARGVLPAAGDEDQHDREAVFRLVRGELLMSTVIADAALAISVLADLDVVDACRIGALGHSMGGHTVLFSAGLDDRVQFAAISGALGSYRGRIAAQTGIELAQAIPGSCRSPTSTGCCRCSHRARRSSCRRPRTGTPPTLRRPSQPRPLGAGSSTCGSTVATAHRRAGADDRQLAGCAVVIRTAALAVALWTERDGTAGGYVQEPLESAVTL